MGHIVYVDGAFVDSSVAQLPVNDLAVLRGYGVFDFTRTYGGRPFRLDAHLQRLQHSAQLVGLPLPLPAARFGEEARAIALETLARNAFPEAGLRIVITGGSSPDSITPTGRSRLLMLATPFRAPPAHWFREGVNVISHAQERFLPAAKTINYVPAIVALRRAQQAGAVEAIYLNRAGHALEGTTTNLFALFGAQLVTPAAEILPGVTRQAVLELAALRLQVTQRALPLAELLRADEVFLSSSSKEICPVVQVDDTRIGAGTPGPQTRALMRAFARLRESP